MYTEQMKAASFIIVLASYGAGKTHVRKYRLEQLVDREKPLVVNLYGNDGFFNGYLESYSENVKKLGEDNADLDTFSSRAISTRKTFSTSLSPN